MDTTDRFRNNSALRIALRDRTDRNCAGCEGEYATPLSRGRRLTLDGGTPVPRQAIEHGTFFFLTATPSGYPGASRLKSYVLLRREWPRIEGSSLQAEHSKAVAFQGIPGTPG